MIQGLTAIGFIILFALSADTCLPIVAHSVNMFLFQILPSIFPFYVAANFLTSSDLCVKAANKLSPVTKKLFGLSGCSSIAILIGFVSGYPAGAKITADLYEKELITRKEAYTLSAFTNNCGPLFLIGTVGSGLLGNHKIGIILWLIHILSALLTGMIFRCRSKDQIPYHLAPGLSPSKKQGLSPCMTDAMMSMIPIGAAVIFFSAFIGIIDSLRLIPEGLSPLTGIVEITNGISRTVSEEGLSPVIKMCLLSAIAAWSGISVHIQVTGILSNAGLSSKKYFLGKIFHMIIATFITLSFFCFLPIL